MIDPFTAPDRPPAPAPEHPPHVPGGAWPIGLGALLVLLLLTALAWTFLHQEEPTAEAHPSATLQRAGEEVAVVLDSAALRCAGIRTEVLRGDTRASQLSGSAGESTTAGVGLALTGELVLDPGRSTSIRTSVPGRLVAPDGRWPALGEHVAAGAVVAQVSDAQALVAPRGGVVTSVGAQPGELVQSGQELLRLEDLSGLLARIAWRPDAPPPPTTLRLVPTSVPDHAVKRGWLARLVGPAAEVDSITRFPVFLYRLTGVSAAARPGLPVTARLPDRGSRPSNRESQTALVPTDAVVQWQGLAWVFVARTSTRFVRVRVDTSRPTEYGWLVIAGRSPIPDALAIGDAVVVRGAQQLLSAEFRSQLPKDDDERD